MVKWLKEWRSRRSSREWLSDECFVSRWSVHSHQNSICVDYGAYRDNTTGPQKNSLYRHILIRDCISENNTLNDERRDHCKIIKSICFVLSWINSFHAAVAAADLMTDTRSCTGVHVIHVGGLRRPIYNRHQMCLYVRHAHDLWYIPPSGKHRLFCCFAEKINLFGFWKKNWVRMLLLRDFSINSNRIISKNCVADPLLQKFFLVFFYFRLNRRKKLTNYFYE